MFATSPTTLTSTTLSWRWRRAVVSSRYSTETSRNFALNQVRARRRVRRAAPRSLPTQPGRAEGLSSSTWLMEVGESLALRVLGRRGVLKVLLTALSLTFPYSYLVLIFSFGMGRIEEVLFAIAALCIPAGFLFWGMETAAAAVLSIVLGGLLSVLIGLLVVVKPFTPYGPDLWAIVAISYVQRVIPPLLLVILPLSILFMLIGILLSERVVGEE